MKKHGSDLVFCGCKACRKGLHAGKWGKSAAKSARRKMRRQTKQALRDGRWDEVPVRMSVTYTD